MNWFEQIPHTDQKKVAWFESNSLELCFYTSLLKEKKITKNLANCHLNFFVENVFSWRLINCGEKVSSSRNVFKMLIPSKL